MAGVICPFCLKPHDFNSSLTCTEYTSETVPPVYVRNYKQVPPLWLVTVGFPRHGKTTYLAALTLMLENIGSAWNGVYYRALDQYTFDAIRQMRREAILGELPPSNPKIIPRPLLFSVHDLPESGSRCLVMYDVAGQVYNTLGDVEYVASIKQVSTTWFLVSLRDLQEDKEGKTITDLFNVYLSGMENLRVDLNRRNLIVVYTKADLEPSTVEIRDYLRTDPFQRLTLQSADLSATSDFSLNEYAEKMTEVSDYLEDYTRRRVKGGAAFISMVRAHGMNLVFCVTSALGQSPDATSNRLREDAPRYRVLDPFLWAIRLEKPTSFRPVCLVLDASSGSKPVYEKPLLTGVWEQLSDHGELTTYYLGQISPASYPGQRPPEGPPHVVRKRLIGPILEEASPDTRFMVISTGPVIDLADFYNSPWRERLLLVSIGEDNQQDWPNTRLYRAGDSPVPLIDALLRL